MRRSTSKAAVAVVALSVAIPAFANTQYTLDADGNIVDPSAVNTSSSDYVVGPDGSIEYAPPASSPGTPELPFAEVFTPQATEVEPLAYGEPVPVASPTVIDEAIPMEILSDARATVNYAAPMSGYTQSYQAPVIAQPYMAPAPVQMEVMPAPAYVAPAPTYAEPAMPAYVQPAAPAPVYSEPMATYASIEPDYTTLVDTKPMLGLESLPTQAPSGLEIASRGDGAYGPTRIDRGGESSAAQSTDIFISKTAILNLPADAAEVSVSDPTQVRAILRTARQIMLIGLKVGQTNIIAFDSDNNQILSLDVNVRYDLRPLREALKRNFPNTHVDVETVLGEVILTGAASGPGEATEIRQLVRRYLYSAMIGAGVEANADDIQFVDRLATTSDDQVMLKVRVAEMRRSIIKQFGVDWSVATSAALAGSNLGGAIVAGDIVSSINSFGVNGTALGGLSGNIAGSIGSTDFGALVRAFERHNVMRTLAEPTLTAVTGETASFLAGGQFPYPVSVDDNGNIGYDFRDFGVALEFTPVVVGDGRISLRIATEVSELTNEGALSTAALTIPGISVRRANTTVEIPSGGTMSIAGMLLQRDSASHAGLPGLKNVPVVGQLFSSSDYLKEETELVILVTPYVVKPGQERDFRLPTDGFAPASDIDFFLLGRLHKVYGSGDANLAAARQALKAPLGFIIE